MKRFSTGLLALLFMTFFTKASAQNSAVVQTANTNENQPYKVHFSNLSFGNEQFSKFVLNAWKAYDNNALDDIAFIISDTVKAGMPDGTMIRGKEAFMNGLKTYRGGFSSAVSTVSACTTVKSPTDPLHEVTLIWGNELDTKKDGTTQRVSIHEVWFFNKAGKVTEFYQYAIPLPNE